MGPHQLLADFVRPLDAGIKTTPEPEHEQPSSRFNAYLDDARGVRPADRSDEAPESTDTHDEDVPGDDEKKSNVDDDTPKDAPVASEAAPETIVVTQPVLDLVATNAETTLTATPVDGGEGDDGSVVKTDGASTSARVPSASPTRAPATDGSDQPHPAGHPVAKPVVAARGESTPTVRQTDPTAARAAESPLAEHADAPVSSGRETRSDSASQAPNKDVIQPASEPSGRENQPNVNKDPSATIDRAETAQPVADPANRRTEPGVEHDSIIPNESIQQRKVKASIEDRREGDSDERHAEGDKKEAKTGGPRQVVSRKGAQPKIKSTQILQSLKTITVRTGQGDGAAASIARLLVTPPASASTHPGPGPQGVNAISQAVGGTPGDAPSSPANLVGDLLASRAEGNDAIEGVARMLNTGRGSGRYQATMQLDPPELGQLRVQVRMHQQAMTLHVQAESHSVARMIESRLSDLREALGTHGIRIDRAHVVVRTPDTAEAETQQSPHHAPRDRGDGSHAGTQRDFSHSSDGGASRTPDDRASGYDQSSDYDRASFDPRAESDVETEGSDIVGLSNRTQGGPRSVDLVA